MALPVNPRQVGRSLLQYLPILVLTLIVAAVVLRLMGGQIWGAFHGVIATLQGP
jgi:hypothetical protein